DCLYLRYKIYRMKACHKMILFSAIVLFLHSTRVTGQEKAMNPVTKNASAEARALLKFFYSISGQYILTGQHNFPNARNRNTEFAANYIGKRPIVYSTDWGFDAPGTGNSYLARQDIVDEVIQQNKLGSLITICWHAVPPTANEPVTFEPLPGADSTRLASVQGKLLDQQFKDVLTPGTELYKHWCQQVDTIAVYLRKLQDAHVPVLWRPYHEMNGNWFWWGARTGEYSTIRLYRQLFDRLVNHHKLNNLVWMWNVDRPSTPARKFTNFYVGEQFFDIASLDVYGSDFNQNYYDSLLVLAKGKPILFGEVGNPPTPEVLKRQPKWAYYVVWASMTRLTTKKQYQTLINDSHVLTMEDAAYRQAIAPYRSVAGLDPMPVEVKKALNFSGQWVFNEDASILDNGGTGNIPYLLAITQTGNDLDIKRTMVSEYSDNTIMEEQLTLDGKEKALKAPYGNRPRMVSAHLSAYGDTLFIDSKTTFTNGGRTIESTTNEAWTLQENGRVLSVKQTSNSFRGRRAITGVYYKQ
ncbi:MAG: Mannan endo,4-beta-mannosidase, partial [Chitinophagaceae bacterium]|nr:Mannan endo,4-beta-mannosidase [Chitinophagaceae bacterium]